MTSRVRAHRRANKPVRGHARHFRDAKTFSGKVSMLKRRVPSMPDREARGIVSRWIQRHEG